MASGVGLDGADADCLPHAAHAAAAANATSPAAAFEPPAGQADGAR